MFQRSYNSAIAVLDVDLDSQPNTPDDFNAKLQQTEKRVDNSTELPYGLSAHCDILTNQKTTFESDTSSLKQHQFESTDSSYHVRGFNCEFVIVTYDIKKKVKDFLGYFYSPFPPLLSSLRSIGNSPLHIFFFAGYNSNTEGIFCVLNFAAKATATTVSFDAFAQFDKVIIFENSTCYVNFKIKC